MRLVTYLAVSVLAASLVAAALYGPIDVVSKLPALTRVYTRWVPPEPPPQLDGLSEPERVAFGRLGARVRGRVVWSSNREDNHELYLVDLTTGEERRLTRHPNVEFFSRFSPDGATISFLRSQREWVSFREDESWDLFLIDADGGNERRVAREAYHPTWVPDGSGLVFMRQNRIVRYDLASGTETVLHDGADPPTRGRVEEPELLTESLVAITLRNVPEETVGILDLASGTYSPMSRTRDCQITWIPGQQQVVWIEGEGRGGTRVMQRRLDAGDPEPLIDLPHEYSHEYFPRVTADGAWLIWGAAAEGHEHDRADYELFVWQIGEPWEQAWRLTHSPANDQWPDLWLDSGATAPSRERPIDSR